MKRETKSIINSLIIILLYYFALVGITRLFWNTTNQYQFDGRVKFLGYLLILLTILIVLVPYYIFSMPIVERIYQGIIVVHLSVLFLGCSYYFISKD